MNDIQMEYIRKFFKGKPIPDFIPVELARLTNLIRRSGAISQQIRFPHNSDRALIWDGPAGQGALLPVRLRNVYGDGSCFYRSISFSLFLDEVEWIMLKRISSIFMVAAFTAKGDIPESVDHIKNLFITNLPYRLSEETVLEVLTREICSPHWYGSLAEAILISNLFQIGLKFNCHTGTMTLGEDHFAETHRGVMLIGEHFRSMEIQERLTNVHLVPRRILPDQLNKDFIIQCVSANLRMSEGFAEWFIKSGGERPDAMPIPRVGTSIIHNGHGFLVTKSMHYDKPTDGTLHQSVISLSVKLRKEEGYRALLDKENIICPAIGTGRDRIDIVISLYICLTALDVEKLSYYWDPEATEILEEHRAFLNKQTMMLRSKDPDLHRVCYLITEQERYNMVTELNRLFSEDSVEIPIAIMEEQDKNVREHLQKELCELEYYNKEFKDENIQVAKEVGKFKELFKKPQEPIGSAHGKTTSLSTPVAKGSREAKGQGTEKWHEKKTASQKISSMASDRENAQKRYVENVRLQRKIVLQGLTNRISKDDPNKNKRPPVLAPAPMIPKEVIDRICSLAMGENNSFTYQTYGILKGGYKKLYDLAYQEIIEDDEYCAKLRNIFHHNRHDLFSIFASKKLNLPESTDTNAYIYLAHFFNNYKNGEHKDDFKRLCEGMTFEQKRVLENLTPDFCSFVLIDNEKNMQLVDHRTEENLENLTFLILDYTCTNNRSAIGRWKHEKYKKLKDLILSPATLEILCVAYLTKEGIIAHHPDIIKPIEIEDDDQDWMELFEFMTKALDACDARFSYSSDFNNIKLSDTLGESSWIDPLESNLTKKEFQDLKVVKEVYRELLNEIGQERANELENLIDYMTEDELLYELDSNDKIKQLEMLESRDARIKFGVERMMDIGFKMEVPYKKPEKDLIKKALVKCLENCKDRFEELEESKLITHLPLLVHTDLGLTEEKMTQQLKQLKFYSDQVKTMKTAEDENNHNTDADLMLNVLKKIFSYSEVSDEQLSAMKSGRMVLSSDGHLRNKLNNKIYDQEMKEVNENEIQIGEPCIKVGKHAAFKPIGVTKREYKAFNDEVRLNIRSDPLKKDANVKYNTKVKSLNFWDESSNRKNLDDYDILEENLCNDLKSTTLAMLKKHNVDKIEDLPGRQLEFDLDFESKGLLYGCEYLLKQTDSFYENLSFVSSFGCTSHRFVFSSNPMIVGVTFPSDSIIKAGVKKPYSVIVFKRKNMRYHSKDVTVEDSGYFEDLFNPIGQKFMRFENDEYEMLLSHGKSESSKTITARIKGLERFRSLFGCYYSLLKKHSTEVNHLKLKGVIMKCLFLVLNININNSSLLDNLRYLINNALANYSAADEFIVDKLQIPCKNLFQVKLFHLSKCLLQVAQEDSKSIKLSQMEEDEEGNLMDERLRVSDAEISSFLNPSIKFNCPDALLQEVIACYFATNKGLHDPIHNGKDIHKTPIEIQLKLNELKEKKKLSFDCIGRLPDVERHQFDIDVLIASNLCALNDVLVPSDQLRSEILKQSGVNDDVFDVKTMTSTRTTIREVAKIQKVKDSTSLTAYYKERFPEITKTDFDLLNKLQMKLKNSISKFSKRQRLKEVNDHLNEFYKSARKELSDVFRETFKYSKKENCIILAESGNFKENEALICPEDSFKMMSVPVLTELLKDHVDNFKEKNIPSCNILGRISKEKIKENKDILVAIRPKMQRTQKDREIYVLNMHGKFLLYPIEHTYKVMSRSHPSEKISVAGDQKIITMKGQMDDMLRWSRNQIKYKENANKNSIMLHMNLDFTKWSPKDNTLKYIWVVASNYCLKPSEKRFMIAALCQHYKKKIHIDYNIISSAMKSKNELRSQGLDPFCHFEKATNGFKTAFFEVNENWLQGQLNYISSFLHSGCMGLWDRCMRSKYKGDAFKGYYNTHSDDNQTSIAIFTSDSEFNVMKNSMSLLHTITKGCTFEPSIKKNYISTYQKEFISQLNVAGQQKSFWVKPVMSAVSGVPNTTVKDDYSSVYSKMSEALIKGAPIEAVKHNMQVILDGIDKIYGLSSSDGSNLISEKLGIPIEYLPTCLGGRLLDGETLLGVLGPSCVDKVILQKLLIHAGHDIHGIRPGQINSDKDEQERDPVIKALKLFYVMDLLSKSTNVDVQDLDLDKSFNPFKSVKYRIRGNQKKDPFWSISEDERKTRSVQFLKDRHTGLIMKPRLYEETLDYYNILYRDHTFRSSLLGQSPDSLMLHKICNKVTNGNFCFVSDETFERHCDASGFSDLTNIKEKRTMTVNLLIVILSNLISFTLKNDHLEDLYNRHIKHDEEFLESFFANDTIYPTGVSISENLVPLQSKVTSNNASFENPINLLMLYLFDGDKFIMENRTFPKKERITHDFLNLFDKHYDLILILQGLYEKDERRYANYGELLTKLIKEDSKFLTLRNKIISLQTANNHLISQLALNLLPEATINKNNLKENEDDCENDDNCLNESEMEVRAIEEDKVLKDALKRGRPTFISDGNPVLIKELNDLLKSFLNIEDPEELARYLKNRSGIEGVRKLRTFFVPKGTTNSPSDLVIGLRVSMTMNTKFSRKFNCKQLYDYKVKKRMQTKITTRNWDKACSSFANLYTILNYLGLEENDIRTIMTSVRFWKTSIYDVVNEFKKLSARNRVLMTFLSIMFSIDLKVVNSNLEHMNIDFLKWIIKQECSSDPFSVLISNLNFQITVAGKGTIFERIEVSSKSGMMPGDFLFSLSNLSMVMSNYVSMKDSIQDLGARFLLEPDDKLASEDCLSWSQSLKRILIVKKMKPAEIGFRIIKGSTVKFKSKLDTGLACVVGKTLFSPFHYILHFSGGTSHSIYHRDSTYSNFSIDRDVEEIVKNHAGLNIKKIISSDIGMKILRHRIDDLELEDLFKILDSKQSLSLFMSSAGHSALSLYTSVENQRTKEGFTREKLYVKDPSRNKDLVENENFWMSAEQTEQDDVPLAINPMDILKKVRKVRRDYVRIRKNTYPEEGMIGGFKPSKIIKKIFSKRTKADDRTLINFGFSIWFSTYLNLIPSKKKTFSRMLKEDELCELYSYLLKESHRILPIVDDLLKTEDLEEMLKHYNSIEQEKSNPLVALVYKLMLHLPKKESDPEVVKKMLEILQKNCPEKKENKMTVLSEALTRMRNVDEYSKSISSSSDVDSERIIEDDPRQKILKEDLSEIPSSLKDLFQRGTLSLKIGEKIVEDDVEVEKGLDGKLIFKVREKPRFRESIIDMLGSNNDEKNSFHGGVIPISMTEEKILEDIDYGMYEDFY